MSSARSIVAAVLLTTACTIQRDYVGNEFKDLPEGSVVVGQTTKREILEQMGPPDRILRQYDGDVFVYAYIRRNASTFAVEVSSCQAPKGTSVVVSFTIQWTT